MSKNEWGFTLVELMIGIAILTLIMGGTYGILASSIKSYQYNFEEGQNIQDERQLFNELAKGIKNATGITSTQQNLTYLIKDSKTNITDTYIVSLNTTTNAVIIQKNDTFRSFGNGRVHDIKFILTDSGSKKEINIQLFFKNGDPTKPLQTTITTLNDIL